MRELQYRQKLKKQIYSKPVFVVILILTILMVKAAIGMVSKEFQSKNDLAQVSSSVLAMKNREQELNTDIQKLGTQRGVEEEIRTKYSVVKSGEQVVVLVDEKGAQPQNKPVDEGLWHKVLSFFGLASEATTTLSQ